MTTKIHKKLLESAASRYPDLHKMIDLNGVIEIHPGKASELFDYLARTVVGQQLSVTAAKTIWQRVEQLAESRKVSEAALFSLENEEEIRSCGLSRSKFKAICGLTQAIKSGSLDGQQLLSAEYEQVLEMITALWGFGSWSADMCAISFCGLKDIYPEKDVSIVNGLQKVCGTKDSSEQIAQAFSPYRSYLCHHIWRGMDNGFIS